MVKFTGQSIGHDAILHGQRQFLDFFCHMLKCLEAIVVDRNFRICRKCLGQDAVAEVVQLQRLAITQLHQILGSLAQVLYDGP